MGTRAGTRAAFGDYQTPPALARRVCELLRARGLRPHTVIEPTCGLGSFLIASAAAFPGARRIGRDINPAHIAAARRASADAKIRCELEVGDFFATDWRALAQRARGPVLVLGNPPWITSADLTALGSDNAPKRANLKGLKGLDARTGKGNFDISEWMLLHLVERIGGAARGGARGLEQLDIAMLLKTAVARRLLAHLAGPRSPLPALGVELRAARLWRVDARAAFAAAVDASLFHLSLRPGTSSREPARELACPVHARLEEPEPSATLGVREGRLIADLEAFRACEALIGTAAPPWRSGLKHDCARVMELRREGARYRNGLGQLAALEPERVFPLLKSGALARHEGDAPVVPQRWVLVPQSHVGEDTSKLARETPRTWAYLEANGARLDARRSSIYRGRPRFSIFGIGPYAFRPWKVAVSGLHKRVRFALVGPHEGAPVMLDDTCYFLGFDARAEAAAARWLLNTTPARQLVRAFLFVDMKRPVTKELLGRLELAKLARAALAGEVPSELRAELEALASASGARLSAQRPRR